MRRPRTPDECFDKEFDTWALIERVEGGKAALFGDGETVDAWALYFGMGLGVCLLIYEEAALIAEKRPASASEDLAIMLYGVEPIPDDRAAYLIRQVFKLAREHAANAKALAS